MNARATQIMAGGRRTEVANRGDIHRADILYGAVKAFNTRQQGKTYPLTAAPDALYEAVKAFNTRRLG